ncbi:MAG: CDP-diacylglycerol--glycerol-3-phosphate 3-phosphatidyltransferase [Oscillospiraceae bacterium]|nr:CDP-diacylglycerol--glycerol-3-phosphate 3-phosphatidyltransferase [Oscillospiraceae bacterium]
MNTANKITMTRVLLIPVFVALLYIKFEVNDLINNVSIALLVFIIAALTDVADGIVARARNQVTDFGTFMDPLADKIMTFAAMLWFIEVELMPAWLVLIIIVREFMVTGMRLVAAAKSTVIAASIAGKVKTVVTVCCIIAMFLIHMFFPTQEWMLICCWTLIGITTVVSGIEYLIKNKDVIKLSK